MAGFESEVRGASEFNVKLNNFGVRFDGRKPITKACYRVQRNVRTEQMAHQSGPPLPDKITARHGGAGLSGAIGINVEQEGRDTVGRVGVGADSVAHAYGRVHEFGGTIPHRGGGVSVMPERAYLRPGLEAERKNIQGDIDQAISETLRSTNLT